MSRINDTIARFLEAIWRPGEVREVRIPRHNRFGHTASGYSDDPKKLAAVAATWDGRANIYISANPVNPALLARAANRIVDRAERTTADADIVCRRWPDIDIDPVRPSGISATDEELDWARQVTDAVAAFLESNGWPDPIVVMSGNGYRLLYPIDLPNNEASSRLVRDVLTVLAERFDTGSAHIDPSVSNPSRMVGLIGTTKVKGDSLPDRPHRRSRLERVPDTLVPVPQERLEAVAAPRTARGAGGNGERRTVNLDDVLRHNGIEYREQPPDAQGITWYHVERCPFHDDGRPFECGVGQKLPDGPFVGHCFHHRGEGKGWQQWKAALGLDFGSDGPRMPGQTGDDEGNEQPDTGEGTRRAAADRLVELALNSGAILFHDQRGEAHIAFSHDGRRQLWPLSSRAARHWLSRLAWKAERKAPPTETLRTAINALESFARFEGEEHRLEVRVARHEGAIWYDLGDWRAVRISALGCDVIEQPPILFRHFAHQKPQAEPVWGGNLHQLLGLLNLAARRQQLLLLVYLVVSLVPDIPRPVLVVCGGHGSGKSTLFGFIRALLDPSHLTRQSAPDSLREFVQIASHSLCLLLDNVSHLPGWMSDAFCRLCTGDGFSKRQLYTDDDDIIYAIRGLGGINGINNVASRPDLLDRALILTLESIPDRNRRLETECIAEFEGLQPSLLGAIFDTLSQTMAMVDSIHLSSMPRMADFARWGCAAARVLGYADRDFLTAFDANTRQQNESALESSPVAAAVLELMADTDAWEDTPAATLDQLTQLATDLRIDTRGRIWPKSPSVLTRRLNEIRPNLMRAGIVFNTGQRSGQRRTISFHVADNAVIAVTPTPNAVTNRGNAVTDSVPIQSHDDGNDSNDGILPGFGGNPVASIRWEEDVP